MRSIPTSSLFINASANSADASPKARSPAEVKALRESVTKSRPGSRALLPKRNTKTREEFETFKRDRKAAVAVLAEMVRSAAAGEPTDLERLSEQLRNLHDNERLRFDPESLELGLQPDQVRTIASHLLRNGVTGTEVLIGLQLMTIRRRSG